MTGPGSTGPETFDALARCFLVATEAVAGPDVRAGTRGALVFGATAIDLPGLSRVMTAEADEVPDDRDIDAVLGETGFAPVMSWWVPPGAAAAAIEASMARRGFAVDPDDPSVPAMSISLDALPHIEPPAGVTIEPATSVSAVLEACLVAGAGFGLRSPTATALARLLSRIGDRPGSASHVLLARFDGRPVASALAVVAEQAVVIYNVATIPEARGRGIGGSITLAALHDGRSRGARLGVLESSEMGYGVYRRLGFRDVGRYRVLIRRQLATGRPNRRATGVAPGRHPSGPRGARSDAAPRP